jgi:anti-sigma B factor antagonist
MDPLMHVNGREPAADRDLDFRLLVSAGANATVVVPGGELDIATTPELEAVLAAQTGRVVVDLREVTFADATALRALLGAQARSGQNGMDVGFIAGRAVSRLIEVVGLADPLTLVAPPAP